MVALSVKKCENWKLQTTAVYKDFVVFQIDSEEEYLVLSDKIRYISVKIHHKEELPQSKHQVLCHKLYENLKEIHNTIHLDGEFMFGFMCKEQNCKNIAMFR